jgi:hypothetical protein
MWMTVAQIVYETVHEDLVAEAPEFGPVVEEHRAFHDGVLQHVLFGDLTRFVLSARERGDSAVVGRSLAFLERANQSDDQRLRELVGVSFVENVGPWDPEMRQFISEWPAGLQETAGQMGWTRD